MPKPLKERLLAKTIPEPNSGCWLWEGHIGPKGYGYIGSGKKGKTIRTNRASWIVHNGPIPDGLHVLHKCDVRCCINPDHLFLGTNADNALDKKLKGRAKGINKGSKNGRYIHGNRCQ